MDRSAPERPGWLTAVPADTEGQVFCVGRAEASGEAGALASAREDAYRQLVDTLYGSTLSKRYARVRTEIRDHIVDQLTSESEGRVAGARAREVYWERMEVRAETDTVSYYYRGYVLVEADRERLAAAVERWVAASPPVVEAKALVREAGRVVGDVERLAGEGLRAAEAGRTSALARLIGRVEALEHDLDRAASRYQALTGEALPVGREAASAAAERLRAEAARAQRSVHVGYVVAGGDPEGQTMLAEGLGRALAEIGIAGEAGGAGGCRDGWSHRLVANAAPPACRRPGMGFACELALELRLEACPSGLELDRARIDGRATRGAAMDRDTATRRAWEKVAAAEALRDPLADLLGRHVPFLRTHPSARGTREGGER